MIWSGDRSTVTIVRAPGPVRAIEYRFSVGTAGAARRWSCKRSLPAVLLTAEGPTTLLLEGGTHNPWAALQLRFSRLCVHSPDPNRMGPHVSLELERCGFFPAGGGRFRVDIQPAVAARAVLTFCDRGEIRRTGAGAFCSSHPAAAHPCRREVDTLIKTTGLGPGPLVD